MTLDLDAPPSNPPTTRHPDALGPRRLRRTPALRALVRETRLDPSMLVAPLFVQPGSGLRQPIGSMPGVHRMSPDVAADEAARLADLGVGGVILFGLPGAKDALGTEASADDGVVQQAFRRIRERDLPIVTIADTCLCEYTDHGHCGPLAVDGSVDNAAAVARLAEIAVSQARAGADIVAPSAMMDGQVAAIRSALDANGFGETAIMAYAAKHASAFYGPFREAADSAPAFGDRRSYQMDPANGREAMREMALDVAEGADILLVKPALPGLDLVAAARARFDVPIAAYQVSGEFAMIAAAAERGWLDGPRAMTEAVTAIVRAGAGIVITYAAADLADMDPGRAMSDDPMSDQMYIQALGLALDPAWRRLSDADRHQDGCDFRAAYADVDHDGGRTLSYSSIGLEPGVDVLLWRMAPSMEALETSVAPLFRAGLGRWLSVTHSMIGRIGPSQYVRKPTEQEQSLFTGDRSAYLIVYPFTKSTEWYLLGKEARQGVMNEHMRVGHDYPTVRQLLAYSFGLDSQDFVVAYETDDLVAFGDLVRALRSTESRRSTVNDTPILLGIHHPIDEILGLLGAD